MSSYSFKIFLLGILIIFCSIYYAVGQSAAYEQKINIRNIQALTFRKGYMTTGRRLPPVVQLKRVGGNAQTSYEPEIVQCKNVGFDGISVQWDCVADMPKKYRLGSVRVVCEGYEHSKDSNVLVGSCGLEYQLESKPRHHRGSKKQHHRKRRTTTTTTTSTTAGVGGNGFYSSYDTYVGSSIGELFGWLVFAIVVFVLILALCSGRRGTAYVDPVAPIYPSQAAGPIYSTIYPDISPTTAYVSGLATGVNLGATSPYHRNTHIVYQQPTTATTTTTSTSYDDVDNDRSDSDNEGGDQRESHGYGGTDTR